MQIAPELMVGLYKQLPPHAGILSGLSFYRYLFALPQAPSLYGQLPHCAQKILFLAVTHHYQLLHFLGPLP